MRATTVDLRDSLMQAIECTDSILNRYCQAIRIINEALRQPETNLSYEADSCHKSPTSVSPSSDVEFVGVQGALLHIQGIDKERIFTVRKLHRVLESDPVSVLTRYFNLFGAVEKIILLPSRRRCGRMRNSTTGFVILEDKEAVKRVTRTLSHQVSSQSSVEVSRFEFP